MLKTVGHLWSLSALFVLLCDRISGQRCSHWHRRPYQREEKTPLYVGAMFTTVEESTFAGSAASNLRPATFLALQDIGRHPCVLVGYNLTLINKDTQCKASLGIKSFFDIINDKKQIVAIFGGACTATNELVAMATNYWHKVQLSYAEDHPMFSTRDSHDLYGTFYRIVPSHHSQIRARISFLRNFNWTKVGALVQNDDSRYSLLMDAFTTTLEREHNVQVLASRGFSSKKMDIQTSLEALKAKDARIIVGEFNSTFASSVFCQAYRAKLYGANYVWIVTGFHEEQWWQRPAKHLSCSRAQLLAALQGHFALQFSIIRSDGTVVVSDKTAQQYDSEYRTMCRSPYCSYSKYHGYTYDGLWTIALAFEKLITSMLAEGIHFNPDRDLLNSDEAMKVWKQALMETINGLEFEGVTGKVRFQDNERLGTIEIMQFVNVSYVTVGEFDAAENRLYINESMILWKNGTPPVDSTKEVFVRRHVDQSVYCTMCSLVAICILVAICLLVVNIYFRNHKFIKMSSPYMNNLIILGSIVTYCSVILLGLDTRVVSERWFSTVCTAKVWTLCFGFTLTFGSMFSKTWRVHSIFTDVHLHKKAIKDYKLYLLVGVLLLVDCLILVTWVIIDPMGLAVKRLPAEKRTAANVIINPTVEQCKAEHAVVFQALLYGYKGIMLVLGCFLAWETRNVNVPALNDSKYIGMSVYNVVLICSVGVGISFILQDQVNECYIIISLFIIFCTTLTLGLVFVPKIVELVHSHRDPTIQYPRAMMRSLYAMNKSRMETKDIKEKKMIEEKENKLLKKRLNKAQREVAVLVKIIARGKLLLESKEAHVPRRPLIRFTDTDIYGGVYVGPTNTQGVDGAIPTSSTQESSEMNTIEHEMDLVKFNEVEKTNSLFSSEMPRDEFERPQEHVSTRDRLFFVRRRRHPKGAPNGGRRSLELVHCSTSIDTTTRVPYSEPPSASYCHTTDGDEITLLMNVKQESLGFPLQTANQGAAPVAKKFNLLHRFRKRCSSVPAQVRTSVSLIDATGPGFGATALPTVRGRCSARKQRFLAEQRPRTVGKAVAPKPGLNTEVISPDGSRFDLTGPHRCLGRGGRTSPEGQNWLAGPQQQDTYRSADDEPRGGSKASLNVFLAPRVQK
uniref:Gamma-aminobutyric acid type B receptor subunit 2 n=1 Tax=Trichuris muris TaxID=70415 RepID=A0A5S6R1T9_TRIMR